jgi:hypothetical protein
MILPETKGKEEQEDGSGAESNVVRWGDSTEVHEEGTSVEAALLMNVALPD